MLIMYEINFTQLSLTFLFKNKQSFLILISLCMLQGPIDSSSCYGEQKGKNKTQPSCHRMKLARDYVTVPHVNKLLFFSYLQMTQMPVVSFRSESVMVAHQPSQWKGQKKILNIAEDNKSDIYLHTCWYAI